MRSTALVLILAISIHSTTRVETPGASILHQLFDDFNPLHHEGGDADTEAYKAAVSISIHSTTRVETSIELPLMLP